MFPKSAALTAIFLLHLTASPCPAGTQFPGQAEGQNAAIARALADTGPRVFTGPSLRKLNYPLAGMGTGIIYFDGAGRPARWDIGTLGDAHLMAHHSLFALSVSSGTTRTLHRLQGYLPQPLPHQPTSATRTGFGQQGNWFIGTAEAPANFSGHPEDLVGTIETDTFFLPPACKNITALVGGGNDIDRLYLGLIDAPTGRILARLTGSNREAMTTRTIRLGPSHAGRPVRLRIVDGRSGGWGHINVDDIRLLDADNHPVTSTLTNAGFESGTLDGWAYTPPADFSLSDITATVEYPLIRYRFAGSIVDAEIEMFSPMVPLSERDSIIPAGIFHIRVTNKAARPVSVSVLSALANGLAGTSRNQTATTETAGGASILLTSAGYQNGTMQRGTLAQWTGSPEASFCAGAPSASALLDQLAAFGSLKNLTAADQKNPVTGLSVPLSLEPGETKTVAFIWSWHFPYMRGSDIWGDNPADVSRRYVNYYSSAAEVLRDVQNRWGAVVEGTRLYHDTLYDTTLPYYCIDAVSANSDILRSPTFFLTKIGEIYAWEGSDSLGGGGHCGGNCMHVWNYAETLAHLYPELARRWKTVDFTRQQAASGLLNNRIGSVPAPPVPSGEGPAIDGTLGAIAGVWREHLNAPDDSFLLSLWPRVCRAMDGAIAAWDPNNDGVNEKSANTTFDTPVTGENTFIGTQYLAALRAAEEMASIMGDTARRNRYRALFRSGSARINSNTFNGEYYYQVQARQYGQAVMTDHLSGQTRAFQYGLGYLLPPRRVSTSMDSVFRYNFFSPLGEHSPPEWRDPLRQTARPHNDGILIATFPNGGDGTAYYLSEDWPGFNYAAAASLMSLGNTDKALAMVRAIRSRHNGIDYDPLNERECGGYYARSLSSYGILVAASGIEKNGPRRMLGFNPHLNPDHFRSFFTCVDGWGTFEQTRSTTAGLIAQTDRISLKYGSLSLRTLQFYYPETLAAPPRIASSIRLNGAPLFATPSRVGNQIRLTLPNDISLRAGDVLEAGFEIQTVPLFQTNLTGWAVRNGAWADTAYGKQAAGGSVLLSAEEGRNFHYEADITLHGSQPARGGLLFRTGPNPSAGSYACTLSTTRGGMVELYKLPYERIAAYTTPLRTNKPHHLAVIAHGANLKVFLDYNPTPVIAVHDAAYACGRFGLIQSGGAATFQNANRTAAVGGIPGRGLLQWLAFNETTGTLAADSSARGANGTLREGASFSPHGAHGGSAWLDGESGWIDIPDRSFAGDFTLAAWLRLPMPIRIADALVGQEGPGQEINFYGSTLRIHSGKADILAARTATPERIWRHYAVARTGGTVTIYMDGTRDTTGTWTGAFAPQAIGRGSVGFLQGWIDDFVLYDRALITNEIRQLMHHSVQKPQTGPAGTPPKARAAPSRNPQPSQSEIPKP